MTIRTPRRRLRLGAAFYGDGCRYVRTCETSSLNSLNAREGRKGDDDDQDRARYSAQVARLLRHATQINDVSKACRYFGVARASFYRWKSAYERHGDAGLVNRKTAPKNLANQTTPEVVEKVLHHYKMCDDKPVKRLRRPRIADAVFRLSHVAHCPVRAEIKCT